MRVWLAGLAFAGLAVAWGVARADDVQPGALAAPKEPRARPSMDLTRHIVTSSNTGMDQRLSPLTPVPDLTAVRSGGVLLAYRGPILEVVDTTDTDCSKVAGACTKVSQDCTGTSGCTNSPGCTAHKYCTSGECTKMVGCTGGNFCTGGNGAGCTQGENCTNGNYCTKSDGGTCTGGGQQGQTNGCTSSTGCTNGPNCTAGGGCTENSQCTLGPSCTKGAGCTKSGGSTSCTKTANGGANCTKGSGCTSDDDCDTKASNCTERSDNGCPTFDPAVSTCDVSKDTCAVDCTKVAPCTQAPACPPGGPSGFQVWPEDGPVLASLDRPGVPRIDAHPHGSPRPHRGAGMVMMSALLFPLFLPGMRRRAT